MKKTYFITAIILSLSLLSACGRSGDIATSTDAPTEQSSTAELAPTDEKRSELVERESADMSEPEDEVEKDILRMMIGYDNTPPKDMVYHYFYYDMDDYYPSFNSGRLFDDALFMPMIVKIEDGKGTQIELDGVEGRKIMEIFEGVYSSSFEPLSDSFDRIYQEQAKIYAKMPNHDEQQVDKQMEPVDISDIVPDELTFDIPNNPLKMQVISANVVGSGCGILNPDEGKEAPLPSWTTDDGRIIWLNMLKVNLSVPKEQCDVLKAYLTEQISAADKDADIGKDGETNGEDKNQSEPIPPGKNFNNVTGFEGYWYNTTTGHLDFVFYSDLTGYAIDDYDESIHEIEYYVNNEYKMLYIYGYNDIYHCDIIDSNTLSGDVTCVRKPYEGGLEGLQEYLNTPEEPLITDITGFWSDPERYSTACFQFNGDGTGTYYFERGGRPYTMTYTINGNTVNYKLTKSAGTLTIKGSKLVDEGGTAYVRE